MPTTPLVSETLNKKKPLFNEAMIFSNLVSSIKQIEQLATKYKKDVPLAEVAQDEEILSTHLELVNRYLALTIPEDAETAPAPMISEITINQAEKEAIHEWLVDTMVAISTKQQLMQIEAATTKEPPDDAYESPSGDDEAKNSAHPATMARLSNNPSALHAAPKTVEHLAPKISLDDEDDEDLDSLHRPM